MKKAFDIFIGFIHDFAAGCWAATVIAIWWLERIMIEYPQLNEAINALQKRFFLIGLGLVAVVLVSGMGRTFTYANVGHVYGEDAEKLRKKMLIIKHIILFVIFGAGTWWQYSLVY